MTKNNDAGRYVLSADEYDYIHKVVFLSTEFYDDLLSIHHEEVKKEDFCNLAKHLSEYSELHNISNSGLCNALKHIAGIKYEAAIKALLENFEGDVNEKSLHWLLW